MVGPDEANRFVDGYGALPPFNFLDTVLVIFADDEIGGRSQFPGKRVNVRRLNVNVLFHQGYACLDRVPSRNGGDALASVEVLVTGKLVLALERLVLRVRVAED